AGKAGLVVGVPADLTSRFNAVELVRKGSEVLGGKGGGGRPDMAQAGGPDGAKADAALAGVEKALAGAGPAGPGAPGLSPRGRRSKRPWPAPDPLSRRKPVFTSRASIAGAPD